MAKRAVIAAVAVATLMAVPSPAMAASANKRGGGSTTGNDISYPQCGGAYPSGQAFGIVGLNDGLANNWNPCFSSELQWALGSSGKTSQAKASVYVNTADPGNSYNGQPIKDWPGSSIPSDPYGPCDGSNTTACAWEYGYERAQADINAVAAPGTYPWWLDVETGNSWLSGSYGLQMNVADLQGMEYAFSTIAVTAGIYTTSYQWGVITGGDTSDFNGVPDWVPGARTQKGAQSNCSLTPFSGPASKITVTQWTGSYDYDLACP